MCAYNSTVKTTQAQMSHVIILSSVIAVMASIFALLFWCTLKSWLEQLNTFTENNVELIHRRTSLHGAGAENYSIFAFNIEWFISTDVNIPEILWTKEQMQLWKLEWYYVQDVTFFSPLISL